MQQWELHARFLILLFLLSLPLPSHLSPLSLYPQVGPGTETLLLMVDKAPLAVEWRTPSGKNQPNHVWVSQDGGGEKGIG